MAASSAPCCQGDAGSSCHSTVARAIPPWESASAHPARGLTAPAVLGSETPAGLAWGCSSERSVSARRRAREPAREALPCPVGKELG